MCTVLHTCWLSACILPCTSLRECLRILASVPLSVHTAVWSRYGVCFGEGLASLLSLMLCCHGRLTQSPSPLANASRGLVSVCRVVMLQLSHAVCSGTPDWETLVPNHVRDQIKTHSLLGYRSRPAPVLTNGSGDHQHQQSAQDKPQLVPK